MVIQSQQGIEGLRRLFAGHRRRRLAIDHILEGNSGTAEVDNEREPKVAILRLGNVTMFGGDPHHPAARNLVGGLSATIAVPETDVWHGLICEVNSNRRIEKWNRTDFDSGRLDFKHLQLMARRVESGFRIESIDIGLAKRIPQDLNTGFGKFRSIEEFAEKGIGVCGFLADALVCAAFSGVICKRGVGIQIDTHPDYRRRGFATAVGASFILQCLQKNLEPHWSAATPISASLAEKLGYVECDSYEELRVV